MALREFTSYAAKELEAEVLRYWEERQVPQKLAGRKSDRRFFLLDGPPYVNAAPHVGHVKTTTCKDVWTRFALMNGKSAIIQPGFDCHGLPVEVMVEKELGITSKRDVVEMGIEKFDAACLGKILNNERTWMAYYRQLGALRAFFEPYFTYKPYYIESAWWTFKTLFDKGVVVEGERSIHWCPHCETALSGYEVSDSYAQRTDPSVFVKFPVKGRENEYLLVWTTTPWTLPANVAVAVAPEEDYLVAKVSSGERFVVAAKLADKVLGEGGYSVERKLKGKELEGTQYLPAIECSAQSSLDSSGKARRVYSSISLMARKRYKKHATGAKVEEEFQEFVTMEDGTGLVHCAPGHGLTDNLFGKHHGLPALSPVDEGGKFSSSVEQWTGRFVKTADREIIDYLDSRGLLLKADRITHSYPLCWRCKTPLLFRLSPQIYLSVEAVKERILEANASTKWMPPYGEEAFGNWVSQASDWCVSQQRFWGIPIPLWKCGCGERKVIGSVDELRKAAVKDPGELGDLHRHSVDSIVLKCGKCGGEMRRVPDIFNVWFDSAVAPWAGLGYPRANKGLFEENFPVDLVSESQDQIRGWFYVLQFAAMAAFGKPAYKSVAMMGWVVDEKGEKMSKSLGNVVPAEEGIAKIGADAMRLYCCSDIAPWDVQKFSFTNAKDVVRALNVYWNTLKFYETYAPAAGGAPSPRPAKLELEDQWILSRLSTVTSEASKAINEFEFHHAGRLLTGFVVDDFSRWYIKLVRDRVAVEAEDRESRAAALWTMRFVIQESAKLLAPFTPFISEYAFQRVAGEESVHLQSYPVPGIRNDSLEKAMALAMAVTEAANALRQEAGVKLRHPLKAISVKASGEAEGLITSVSNIISRQNNVASCLAGAPSGGGWKSKEVSLSGGEALVVFLNVERDEALLLDALFKETVRAVQDSRKKNGLKVGDRIFLSVVVDAVAAKEFFKSKAAELAREVGAVGVDVVDSLPETSLFSAGSSLEGVAAVKCGYSVKAG